MKYRKYVSKIVTLSIIGILAAGLCGCRASDEIQKIVYTDDANEVDETEIVMNPNLDGERNDSSPEKKTDPDAQDSKQADAPMKGENSNTNETAQVADPNQQGDNLDPDADHESQVGTNSKDGDSSRNGSNGGNQGNGDQAYDPEGPQQEVPEVDGYIAAPGEAGLIVQMLGGEGVLCASSESFLGNNLVQNVFADEGIGEVQALWSGNGSEPMSEENFATLLAMEPQAVVILSGQQNFTDSQLRKLEEQGVEKITIDLTRATNIEGAVEAVGQLLGDHEVGNTTSIELAAEYVTYEKEMVSDVASKKGWFFFDNLAVQQDDYYKNKKSISDGCYTLVLWDWDEDFSFKFIAHDGNTYIDQQGGAVIKAGWKLVSSEYISVAGVFNTSARSNGLIDNNTGKEFIYWPFNRVVGVYNREKNLKGYENLKISINGNGIACEIGSNLAGDGGNDTYNATYEIEEGSASVTNFGITLGLGYTKYDQYGDPYAGDYAMIGSERFPYVIAATGEVKEKMELSKNSENGLYTIRPLGIDVGRTAPFVYTPSNETSLLVQLKNSWVTTFQDYEIIVNPSGCGNWLDGSVESVLESVWCSNLYYGNYDVNKEVKDFYERFYRHSLTSDQLSDVLDGN